MQESVIQQGLGKVSEYRKRIFILTRAKMTDLAK